MKEFTSQDGGRYTYIDDFINLQDLALSMTHIFDGCGNFIISGCNVSERNIGEGYVFIGGKIRKLEKQVISLPAYICASDTVENVGYEDFGDKAGTNVFGCKISSSDLGNSIKIEESGKARRLVDAFIGKYALMMNEPNSQSVKHDVVFDKDIKSQSLTSQKITLKDAAGTLIAGYDENGQFYVDLTLSNGKGYKAVLNTKGEYECYLNKGLVYTITQDAIKFKAGVNALELRTGNLSISEPHIYNKGEESNSGAVNINMLGYNNGLQYFRNTIIGDGKGVAILSVNGQNKQVAANGTVLINASEPRPMVFKNISLDKDQVALQSAVQWQDMNGSIIGELGYANDSDKDFYITNKVGSVHIPSDAYIDGSLYVKGKDIVKTMLETLDLETVIDGMVKKTDSIQVFVDQAGGGEAGQKEVCKTIGATNVSDFNDLKQKVESKAPYTKDTGWVSVVGQGVSGYARQIGSIVNVCGYAMGPGIGGGECPFAIPASIDLPRAAVCVVCGVKGQFVAISTDRSDGQTAASVGTRFNVTYMIDK